jgi:hypothetical protein
MDITPRAGSAIPALDDRARLYQLAPVLGRLHGSSPAKILRRMYTGRREADGGRRRLRVDISHAV